jgi:hypothetical protein
MGYIKTFNEMFGRDDDRYCYFSEKDFNREIYVPETYGDDFTSQFDDITDAELYDLIGSLYDFTAGDERPDRNDREEMLGWIYEYAVSMLEDNR